MYEAVSTVSLVVFSDAKSGRHFFLFDLFYSSTYILSDARCRNSRQQVKLLYISWFETFRDFSACTIEL